MMSRPVSHQTGPGRAGPERKRGRRQERRNPNNPRGTLLLPFGCASAAAAAQANSSDSLRVEAMTAPATSPGLLFPWSSSARVEAVVLFNICDSYVRRPDQAERVIGTLLGSLLPDGTVHVRNSYVVPHSESADQVAIDIDYHRNMYASHHKVNPKELIVGWFSTGFGVSGGSTLIHDFYSREVQNPIHLTVDTGFTRGEASIKAYVSSNLSLGDRHLAAQFQEIPMDLRMIEAEKAGFEILKSTMVEKLPNDLEGMESSMGKLYILIDEIYKYVDDVVAARVAPDNRVGRFIADSVASMPKLSPAAFDKLFNDKIQDNLALVYLSSITRTQISIAEKLNTAAQVL
ncbi:eukaryotic translation initiation factor 3 subunit F-like [Phragmites australis]|uniref:eukaryotic translation initiation factor 3 subunit F-like n=1 Tax=Phragmites australis TaxID=29695 RepID=UPI002D77AC36|nr:eukaryotic translation initiation factor 3 subunit F-like [Phragmites australis]